MYSCFSALCLCIMYIRGVCRDQKRMLNPLELEIDNFEYCVGSLEEQAVLLAPESSIQLHIFVVVW